MWKSTELRISPGFLVTLGLSAVLGDYNLLPIQGLDGRRALNLEAAWIAEIGRASGRKV